MSFLFTPGEWLGEGKIQIGMGGEEIRFFTRWIIAARDEGTLAIQEVELSGSGRVTNRYEVSAPQKGEFLISMTSEAVGAAKGVGLVEERRIAWEFSEGEPLQGFEVYELLDGDNYSFRAQFISEEIYRTKAEGHIWRKNPAL